MKAGSIMMVTGTVTDATKENAAIGIVRILASSPIASGILGMAVGFVVIYVFTREVDNYEKVSISRSVVNCTDHDIGLSIFSLSVIDLRDCMHLRRTIWAFQAGVSGSIEFGYPRRGALRTVGILFGAKQTGVATSAGLIIGGSRVKDGPSSSELEFSYRRRTDATAGGIYG